MTLSRYRLVKYLIVLVPIFYLFMVWLRPVIDVQKNEIFPFYAWGLFYSIPPPQKDISAVVVHSIDGASVNGTRYLIPNHKIADMKLLARVIIICGSSNESRVCDEVVRLLLFPVVKQRTGSSNVEFSVVRVRIDLREVQRNIANLASGRTKRSTYYRPQTVIGRWSTDEGP